MTSQTPDKINLFSSFDYRIISQGDLPICSAASAVSLLEYLQWESGRTHQAYSILYLYYQSRHSSLNQTRIGVLPQTLISTLIHEGVCFQSRWPTHPDRIDLSPDPELIIDTRCHVVPTIVNICPINLKAIKYMIGCLKRPLVASISIDLEFEESNGSDIIHPGSQVLGRHSVLLVGYDQTLRCLIFANSWGLEWGIQGIGRLSYEYLPRILYLWSLETLPLS